MNYEKFRAEVAQAIVDFEARRDSLGRLVVYDLPANDGGGRYEVAGINEKYHPNEAAALAAFIKAGRQRDAERRAVEYIARYTGRAASWSGGSRAVEAYLRDCVFNRGPGGAARILQLALGVVADGKIGPKTRAALKAADSAELFKFLRHAREDYERRYVGYRANFWKGLVNRWDKAHTMAAKYLEDK